MPLCPSGLGLVRRDKDKPLCHPALSWFTRNLLCVRPLVPKPQFAFLPARARSSCWFYAISCVSFPGSDFAVGGVPPLTCSSFPPGALRTCFLLNGLCIWGGWGLISRTALRVNKSHTQLTAGRLVLGSSPFKPWSGHLWPLCGPPHAHPPHHACQRYSSVLPTPDRWQFTHSVDAVKAEGPWIVCISHLSAQFYFLLVHLLASGPQVTYLCAYAWFLGLMTTQQEF